MSIDDFVIRLKRNLNKIESQNVPLKIAALTTHQKASERIFFKSQDINNSKIVFKNPKGKREGAYSFSYAQFRKRHSRSDVSEVTFNLTGDFESDYMNSTSISAAAPIKVNANEYKVEFGGRNKTSISNAALRFVFENVYYKAKIFTLSKQEIELFYKVAREEFVKQFQS